MNFGLVEHKDIPSLERSRTPHLFNVAPCGAVTLLTVIQTYAHVVIALLDQLRELADNPEWILLPAGHTDKERAQLILRHIKASCENLRLASSIRQLNTIISVKAATVEDWRRMLGELRRRIGEDLGSVAFFSITDPVVLIDFFKSVPSEDFEAIDLLVWRSVDEVFGPDMLSRFPSALDDMDQACRCFALSRYPACVFHLMRVIEYAVRKIAQVADIQDKKPSWGAILQRVEKLCLRTEFKDLPPSVQPNIAFLKDVLPRLQSVQHAWRNKVVHIEDRLIPAESGISEETARDIMNSTKTLMLKLGKELPDGF